MTDVRSVSPALVVGDVVVTQVIPGGNRNKEATPGDIRGFDVRTGKLFWRFHVVPQPGEFGNETWENESWRYAGNSGIWTMMSADPELGYVYIAGDTPSNDFSGVERPGNNLFAESIVCAEREDRQAGLALPDRASRHLGLRQSFRTDPPRHGRGRPTRSKPSRS